MCVCIICVCVCACLFMHIYEWAFCISITIHVSGGRILFYTIENVFGNMYKGSRGINDRRTVQA